MWSSEIGLEMHRKVFLLVISHGDSWLGGTVQFAIFPKKQRLHMKVLSLTVEDGGWVCADGYRHFLLQTTQALLRSISEKAVYVYMFLTAWHVRPAMTCLSWVDSPVQVGLILADTNWSQCYKKWLNSDVWRINLPTEGSRPAVSF